MTVPKRIRVLLIIAGRPIYICFRTILFLMVSLSNKITKRVRKITFRTDKFKRIKILKKVKRPIKLKLIIPAAFILLIAVASIWFYKNIIAQLPDINLIYNPPTMTSKIVDRKGNLLYKFYEDENRSWIPLSKIPQSLIWATLSIEDKEFYKHHGISYKGLAKALIYDFKKSDEDNLRGGSTITQQLVKNIFLNNDKTLERKIKEAILAVMIEQRLNKEEILERYFNQVAYGGETYGAQEAALKYFGKNIWEIDMREAAFLAGLPAAPSSYSPYGPNPEYAIVRQKHVINEMVSAGYIDQKKAEELLNKPVEIKQDRKKIEAPHFVFYVKNLIESKYGIHDFERQGLTIMTSLDLDIQKYAENIVKDEVDKVKGLRIENGAALVVDVKGGGMLAMVGSKDYYASDIDGKFNVTTALRQPGSSIKPINYLLALQNGYNLASTIDDSPVSFPVKGQKPYSPQNYNGKYNGRVTLRTALASSLNIPSVKLLDQNGVNNMIDLAEKMGITTWKDRNRFGLSLALGSGEVKMTELAGAYSIFANSGYKIEIDPILSIKNYLGETIIERKPESVQVINPGYAFLINSVLSDNNARSPIFGLNSKLKINNKTVAVKTGTTNNLKDNWCIGWTPSYLVSAWVGNNDNSPMSWVASGVSGATPIWNRIMSKMISDSPDEVWNIPLNVHKANACNKEEFFINGTDKNPICSYSKP